MKITNVSASAYSVPVSFPLTERAFHLPFVLTEVATDEEIVGHGVCMSLDMANPMAQFINAKVQPELVGLDPVNTERIWNLLSRRFNSHGHFGSFLRSVTSSVDVALWDIKGKYLGQPIARLLGGAHDKVPGYVTFGVSEHTIEELVDIASTLVSEGHTGLKMLVGGHKHPAADRSGHAGPGRNPWQSNVNQDAERVAAVRDAIGPDVDLMLDANCGLSLVDAQRLCHLLEPYNIGSFEEPIRANDAALLRQLRDRTSIPIAAGQFLGLLQFRDLIANSSIDIPQPNVVLGGGFTEASRVASLARSFNLSISNGGAWPHHNLHLHAGVSNGGPVEYHWLAWKAGEAFFDAPPTCREGWAEVPSTPGLGFAPKPADELQQYALTD